MLNLINILTLTTALTTQAPLNKTTSTTKTEAEPDPITINYNSVVNTGNNIKITTNTEIISNFLIISTKDPKTITSINNYSSISEINQGASYYPTNGSKYWDNTTDGYWILANPNTVIYKYLEFNEWEKITNVNIQNLYLVKKVNVESTANTYTLNINTRSKSFMEELLTALTTAVQSAVSIFVQGFDGLTQIFYNGTEITFIGGILVVGLAVMFLMMFLRWIVSFVKGI